MNKKHLSIALSSLLALPLLAPIGSVPTTAAEEADQEVIIVYNNEEGKEAAIEQSEEIQHEFETVPAITATVGTEELQDLVDNPDIAYVERNVEFQLTDFETTSYTPPVNNAELMNWNYEQVAPDAMWQQGFTGKGVKVAVVDSGISPHSELKIVGGISTVGSGTNSNYTDDHGHGTHVAGIIAADSGNGKVVGMAPGVSLYAVKTLAANGKGNLADLLEGLDWAIQNKMDIINLSLGGEDDSTLLHDMVDKAYNQGILVVASAGNSGTVSNTNQDTVGYPAKYDSVISVAAVDEYLNRANFSSTGPKVDIAAPGENILSTYPSALGHDYVYMDGTSQAAPHVSGELALLKEKNPSASAATLRNLLNSYAVDLGAEGRDNLYGNGLITFRNKTDVSAPDEVTDAKVASATADSLTLSWTPPSTSDFKEVRVYSGTDSTFTTVTQSTYQAPNLIADTAYDFRLTTVDTAGNESLGVPVSGRTLAANVSSPPNTEVSTPPSSSGGEPVNTTPVQPTPAPPIPNIISIPVVTTPPPSGGSAQIPSGGGSGGGGGAAAPVATAPAVTAPATPTASPSVPAATVPAKSTVPTPTVTTPSPMPSVPSTVAPTPISIPFQDVPSTFWGRDTIAWAFERGLVKGYADGQFKPGATVTESEFLAMLIRAFEPNVKNSTSGTWSNTYYARAKQLGLPTKGYASKTSRSQTITRAQVAEMLASANGQSYTGNQAIQYLLSTGIASGSSKTSKTVASFKGSATLTRAEALQFIKNLAEKGNGSLG